MTLYSRSIMDNVGERIGQLQPTLQWCALVMTAPGKATDSEGWGGGGEGGEGLLTGVPLCLSLVCGDGTVLVGQENLLQLAHLGPQ